MAGKRSKHQMVRSARPNTKKALGGGKREAGGGAPDEKGRSTDYQRTAQHLPTGTPTEPH